MPAATTPSAILCLDVGDKRVGVAIASTIARLPRPLFTLDRDEQLFIKLQQLVQTETVSQLVVGLPRNLDGQHTAQTRLTEQFVEVLHQQLPLPIDLQDEALTSVQAENDLQVGGGSYQRGDIDALAAAYILDDWLRDNQAEEPDAEL